MEVSTDKTLSGDQLPEYWRFMQHSLVNYIGEVHTAPNRGLALSPGPAAHGGMTVCVVDGRVRVSGLPEGLQAEMYDMNGRRVATGRSAGGTCSFATARLTAGIYVVRAGAATAKAVVVKD